MDPVIISAIISSIALIISTILQIIWRDRGSKKVIHKKKRELHVSKNILVIIAIKIYSLIFNIKKYLIQFDSKILFVKFISLFLSVLLIVLLNSAKLYDTSFSQAIVTNGNYAEFIKTNNINPPIHFSNENLNNKEAVINVTWFNALKYCKYKNGKLFTEKEWRKNVDSSTVIWNLREWTSTDTLNNCAITCDISCIGKKDRCPSYEPKSKYSDKITFRCVLKNDKITKEEFKMKKYIYLIAALLIVVFLFPFNLFGDKDEFIILLNGKLNPLEKFGVGVDDSQQKRDWLAETVNGLEIKYPGALQWGAIFITSGGDAVPPPREEYSIDLSAYKKLLIEMKGEKGGECVSIGIKDYDDPDNGTEPKKDVILGKEWKTHTFDIQSVFGKRPSYRSSLNLKKLYVVCEFVFPCKSNSPQTIYVKTIKYSK